MACTSMDGETVRNPRPPYTTLWYYDNPSFTHVVFSTDSPSSNSGYYTSQFYLGYHGTDLTG
jgi:hypothetical protein